MEIWTPYLDFQKLLSSKLVILASTTVTWVEQRKNIITYNRLITCCALDWQCGLRLIALYGLYFPEDFLLVWSLYCYTPKQLIDRYPNFVRRETLRGILAASKQQHLQLAACDSWSFSRELLCSSLRNMFSCQSSKENPGKKISPRLDNSFVFLLYYEDHTTYMSFDWCTIFNTSERMWYLYLFCKCIYLSCYNT